MRRTATPRVILRKVNPDPNKFEDKKQYSAKAQDKIHVDGRLDTEIIGTASVPEGSIVKSKNQFGHFLDQLSNIAYGSNGYDYEFYTEKLTDEEREHLDIGKSKEQIFEERNIAVKGLFKALDSLGFTVGYRVDEEEEWPVWTVPDQQLEIGDSLLRTPGQMGWHIHQDEHNPIELDWMIEVEEEYDGHTREMKHDRLNTLTKILPSLSKRNSANQVAENKTKSANTEADNRTKQEEKLPTAAWETIFPNNIGGWSCHKTRHLAEQCIQNNSKFESQLNELVRRKDVEQRINKLREKWPDDKAIRELLEKVQNQ